MTPEHFVQPQAEDLPKAQRVHPDTLEKIWDPGILSEAEMARLELLRSLTREDRETEFAFEYPREKIKDLAALARIATWEFACEKGLELRPTVNNLVGRVEGPGYFGLLLRQTLSNGSVVSEATQAREALRKKQKGYTRVFYLPFSNTDEMKGRAELADEAVRFVGRGMGYEELSSLSAETVATSIDVSNDGAYLQLWSERIPEFVLSLKIENYDRATTISEFRFGSLTLYFLPERKVHKLMRAGVDACPSLFGN